MTFSKPLHPEEYAPMTAHESEVSERAERVLMSNAEAFRLVEEAVQMRAERDDLAAEIMAIQADDGPYAHGYQRAAASARFAIEQARSEREEAETWSRRWKAAAHEYRRDLRQATIAWADTLSEFQQASLERDALRAAGDALAEAVEAGVGRRYSPMKEAADRWRALVGGAAGEGS